MEKKIGWVSGKCLNRINFAAILQFRPELNRIQVFWVWVWVESRAGWVFQIFCIVIFVTIFNIFYALRI